MKTNFKAYWLIPAFIFLGCSENTDRVSIPEPKSGEVNKDSEITELNQSNKNDSAPLTFSIKDSSNGNNNSARNVLNTHLKEKNIQLDHKEFDELLKRYVSSSGKVNYQGFQTKEKELNDYIHYLEKQEDILKLSKNEQLAYWINLYNACTIKLILKHYPIQSITKINNGKAWDLKLIQTNGEGLSLNQIENEIIRPQFKDPRIHFALNCAARSCPPLANRAFTGRNIIELLDIRTASFLNSNQNKITKEKLVLSKIFEWYKDDFGSITDFIKKYVSIEMNTNVAIEYTEYDWSLNE